MILKGKTWVSGKHHICCWVRKRTSHPFSFTHSMRFLFNPYVRMIVYEDRLQDNSRWGGTEKRRTEHNREPPAGIATVRAQKMEKGFEAFSEPDKSGLGNCFRLRVSLRLSREKWEEFFETLKLEGEGNTNFSTNGFGICRFRKRSLVSLRGPEKKESETREEGENFGENIFQNSSEISSDFFIQFRVLWEILQDWKWAEKFRKVMEKMLRNFWKWVLWDN